MKQVPNYTQFVFLTGLFLCLPTGEAKALPSSDIIIVDSFQVEQNVSLLFPPGSPPLSENGVVDVTGTVVGSILERERDVILEVTTSSITTTGFALFAAGPMNLDRGSLSSSFGVEATVTLQYDGEDGDATNLDTAGLGSVDARGESGSNTGLLLDLGDFDFTDAGSITAQIYSDSGNNFAEATAPFTENDEAVFFSFAGDVPDVTNIVDVPFAGVLDPATVSAIELIIEGQGLNGSITFDNIAFANINDEVPEIPFEAETAMGLAFIGSWFGWKRWRNRQAAGNLESEN